MSFVVAKCTECGTFLTVDDSRDAAFCSFCGTPFVVKNAIANAAGANAGSAGNINNNASVSSVAVLLKRAAEFERAEQYVSAVEFYEKALAVDVTNLFAKEAIKRIKYDPIFSIHFPSIVYGVSALLLTRTSLIYQTETKEERFPLTSIQSASNFLARFKLEIKNKSTPMNLQIGSISKAKSMADAINTLLASKQYFVQ